MHEMTRYYPEIRASKDQSKFMKLIDLATYNPMLGTSILKISEGILKGSGVVKKPTIRADVGFMLMLSRDEGNGVCLGDAIVHATSGAVESTLMLVGSEKYFEMTTVIDAIAKIASHVTGDYHPQNTASMRSAGAFVMSALSNSAAKQPIKQSWTDLSNYDVAARFPNVAEPPNSWRFSAPAFHFDRLKNL